MQNERTNIMTNNNCVVAIFKSHIEAETAVKELQQAGFDMKKLSIIGRDYHTDEHVVGYYNAGDRMKYWGKLGAFWGGFWGLLFGSAFFFIPGVGPVALRGADCQLYRRGFGRRGGGGRFERAGCRALQHGHSQGQHLQYETAVKSGKYVLIAHGRMWKRFTRGKSSDTPIPEALARTSAKTHQ